MPNHLNDPKPNRESIRRSTETIGLGDSRRGPSTQIELSFSARNLTNRDFLSRSDPICIVYRDSTLLGGVPREIARTETINDNLNPDWSRRIMINYYFEAKQPLIFRIFDIDTSSGSLNEQDFLGSARCDLAEIVAAQNGYLILKLEGWSGAKGNIIVHAQEVDQGQRETLCFNVRGSELKKKSVFNSPNSQLEFYRFLEDGTRHLAHRTTIQNDTQNPNWENQEIPLRVLCNCDKDLEFIIECYDHHYNSLNPRFIGSARTTINQLLKSQTTRLTLLKQKTFLGMKKNRSDEKVTGTLTFDSPHVRIDDTFIDFIKGGLQLEFAVCVDFTASNGQPHSLTSLHHIDSPTPNQYEMAIRSVLEICEHYNHRKLFDGTGFGAKIPPTYDVSHMFPLDVNQMTRRFMGVEGVLHAYKSSIKLIQLYGPTNFAPSVTEFMHKAQQMQEEGNQYQILLILTDGAISDMNKTKDCIIRASELPMSIIIIGVGSDSFDKMDKLDSDATLLENNGRKALRDIVQFVPFRDFVPRNGIFASEEEYYETMRLLAKEVLAEVPDQVTSYMRLKGLKPRKHLIQANDTTAYCPYPTNPDIIPNGSMNNGIGFEKLQIGNNVTTPYPINGKFKIDDL